MNASLPQPEQAFTILEKQLQPWYQAIANPAESQRQVLHNLLILYSQSRYGEKHGASHVANIEDFRQAFPVTDYQGYQPVIDAVLAGDIRLLLNEEPVAWAITRGTTKGESKFIPITATDMKSRVSAGRAMMNFVFTTKRLDLFSGVNLNLNFPSVVGEIQVGEQEIEYGYSSGIYTKYVSRETPIKSLPSQVDIDSLGGGKTESDWHARFDLAFNQCRNENVTLVGGVCPTAIEFGKYTKKKYKVYPKQLWQPRIMTLGSNPGINTTYQPVLNALYGPAAIREIYGATEGMFGQQLDEKRAWSPNYDLFFFEVITKRGIKMLHEMHPGESGSLVVSTPVLPRYHIGDMILAFKPPYFRCIGRDHWWTPLDYIWKEISSFNLSQL